MIWLSKPIASFSDAEIYRLLTGLVVPRPIAFVSTLSSVGGRNLAPFSFFSVVATSPAILSISCDKRHGREVKDTARNIHDTGEFVVNVVSEAIARQMNLTSFDLDPEVDEFAYAGLDPDEATLAVRPSRVANSPVHFECRLLESHEYGGWTLILGQILAVHVRREILDERLRVDFARLAAIGRLAGEWYCRTRERFMLRRDADSPDRN